MSPTGTRAGGKDTLDPERSRLRAAQESNEDWYRWGPYLSARQWGTVREDYSANGDAWRYFPHDMARYRAYRWGEDGLLGLSDRSGTLCFAPALWNGVDGILKERPFGLSNPEGNHGEDLKEQYYFLDNVPTHAYMKALYRYPQRAFPYDDLIAVNAGRTREEPEYELLDTGVFAGNRFFDLTVEYAKAGPDDLVIRLTATNQGPERATLHLLPTLWYRNTWSWGRDDRRPQLGAVPGDQAVIRAEHHTLGAYTLVSSDTPDLLFTENDTNLQVLCGENNATPYVKDAFHRAIVAGETEAVNPAQCGTRAAVHYVLDLAAGESRSVLLRLRAGSTPGSLGDAEEILARRQAEADAFYAPLARGLSAAEQQVMRQSLAGLLWSKQYYNYEVRTWLEGDPAQLPPAPERAGIRNSDWQTLKNDDIILMPDTWEYPWYASWDLAFHCLPMALIDPHFAKQQLLLLTRETYMKPDGQIPAYEWDLSQVNPPVLAWAALKVYATEQSQNGVADRDFLERMFHKLLVNFTWWINRKDPQGRNVFEAGFLGLDNIGVFNRDASLPIPGTLVQADATAWMGMFCLNMLAIALELARERPVYEDIAGKFLDHFTHIAAGLNHQGGAGCGLWDEVDGFYYDCVRLSDGTAMPLKIRSLVGLLPLSAVLPVDGTHLADLPALRARFDAVVESYPELVRRASGNASPENDLFLLSLVPRTRLGTLLSRMLDPEEFLSEHGVRSLSKFHQENPYTFNVGADAYTVGYEPGPSASPLFGGNSNWRGPIWFPANYLLIDALRSFDAYYGVDGLVEYPAGSGSYCSLIEVADDLAARLTGIFLPNAEEHRPVYGLNQTMQEDPRWRDLLLFYEYFHGDTGEGLGANHQTGWTALVATMLREMGDRDRRLPVPLLLAGTESQSVPPEDKAVA